MTRQKALIVDDEAPARRRLTRLLATIEDLEIVGEAESGDDAVTRIANVPRPPATLAVCNICRQELTSISTKSRLTSCSICAGELAGLASLYLRSSSLSALNCVTRS